LEAHDQFKLPACGASPAVIGASGERELDVKLTIFVAVFYLELESALTQHSLLHAFPERFN